MSELNSPEPIRMLQEKLAEVRERADRVGECEALGNLGIAYYQAQEWESAIATLTDYLNLAKALGNQWQEGVAEYYLGFTQQARGEHWQAVEAFDRAYRLFRQLGQEQFCTQVWQQLVQQGQRYFEQQQFLEASQLYKLQLKNLLDFDDIKAASWVAIYLGKVYYYQRDFEQAIACYAEVLDAAKILKEQQMKSSALAWLGCSYRESGQLEQALVSFQKRYAVACQLDDKVAQRETLEALIDISKQLNKHEKTIKFYKVQSSLFKQIKDYPNEYTSLYNLARLQFNCQQYQEALSRFEMALQIAEILEGDRQKVEKIANAHYMLGQCCQNLGQKEAAIASYQQAVDLYLELGIKNWAEQSLEYLVNLYRDSQDYDKEIDCQKKRLKLVQERENRISEQTLSYQIGNLYNNQRKDTEAIEYYQKALQTAEILEGDSQKVEKIANARYMLGQCYRNLGQKETAITWYQQAVNLYLSLGMKNWAINSLKWLSDLYRDLKEYDKALNYQQERLKLAQDIQIDTEVQSIWYNLGCLYQDRYEDEQAVAALTQALSLAQNLPYQAANAHYLLGFSYRRLGQSAKAIEHYRYAERLYQETNTQEWAKKSSVKLRILEAKRTLIWGDSQSIARNTHPYYLEFLEKLLNTDGDENLASTLIRDNSDKLDENFLEIIDTFSKNLETVDLTIAQQLADTILDVSNLINDFPLGERAINLEISLLLFEKVLKIIHSYTPKWAHTQNALGLAYVDRIRGREAENLERAIAAFNAALEVYTRKDFSEYWAMVQTNLGIAYTKRIQGEKAENVEIGISYLNAALKVLNRQDFPQYWAITHMNLGIAYSDRVRGEEAEKLELTIICYNTALEVLTRQEFPQYWAMTQMNLGVSYSDRIRGEKAENLEITIACYNTALEVLTRQEFPQYWAMTQKNLGTAYRNRIQGEKTHNIEMAIACYNAALEVFTKTAFPEDWASIQRILGNTYNNLISGENGENLEKVIACYEAALQVYTRQAHPEAWAETQNNLGVAYSYRIRGNKENNMERAILAYENVLEINTYYEAHPENWATTQNNLGNAYRNRIQGEKAENLEMAITAYKSALVVHTRENYPEAWASTQNNLGLAYFNRIQGDEADNLEKAIVAYENALEIYPQKAFSEPGETNPNNLLFSSNQLSHTDVTENFKNTIVIYNEDSKLRTREAVPEQWASTQANLANAYNKRIQGEKAENIERVMACYKAALQVYTRETFPEEWASTQANLANAYTKRIQGEKAENIERAIACYKAALQVYTRETFPEEWASTQANFANAYTKRIQGEKADNIEKAIACYEAALQVYTREAFPEDWAKLQGNVGIEYKNRIQGEKAENQKRAIACYKVALQVYTQEAFPKDWAASQLNLGNAYLDRIQGKKTENLEIAIAFYKAALQVYTCEAFPKEWAITQMNLGQAYFLYCQEKKIENFELVIAAFEAALSYLSPEAFSQQWVAIQNNLGSAYLHSTQGEKIKNLEKAIACYEKALQVATRETLPKGWATTHLNLGLAYYERIQGEKAENLERAIVYYNTALEVSTREAFPEDWAIIQNNLGSTYLFRIRGERAENIERAIAYYNAALEIRTCEAFPEDWATTQMNLGNAYTDRILGQEAQNLEKAIVAHEQALQVRTREAFPKDWATVHLNLGNAYLLGRIHGDEAQNLEKAIVCFEQALEVFSEAFPIDWAMTQNNLGTAYLGRIHGDKAQNLEKAIAAHEQSLQVLTREAFPQRWAENQVNLGNAYRLRIRGKRADNLERAILLFQKALEIFTSVAFPANHTQTLFSLGLAYQSLHQATKPQKKLTALDNAYTAFEQAIDTVEFLRSEINSGDEAKRKLNEKWNRLYLGMVEVCLELGNYTAAIEYADRSKARNLVELIATRDSYGSEISIEVRQRLQYLRQAIYDEKNRLAQDPNPDYSYINQLREEFQKKSPYKPLEFQQIQSLLDEETAILEWYISDDRFLTFILTPQTLHLQQSTSEDLLNLIDWTNAYLIDYQTNKSLWQDRLSQRLETLAQILHLDEILQILLQNFPTCKKLILIPHRFLHLFPIHALPVHLPSLSGNKTGTEIKLLQECFPKGVSYAPSCQLLQQAKKRQRPHFNQLFAIQNPTKDLDFTDIEVEAIQSYFNPHQILKHDQAEKTAIDLNNVHCAHFSCHGYFNFNDPLKSALLLANSEFSPPPPEGDQTRYIPLQNGNLLDLGKCLTLEDILQLDLTQCRLVTLSACETGITDFTSTSDEYIGLPSGFILAGSPNVVSSLWAVNDLSTALLMIRFYENLNNGETVPLALNHAQIWLRDATAEALYQWSSQLTLRPTYRQQLRRFSKMASTEKPFASPYYWAGFCAIST